MAGCSSLFNRLWVQCGTLFPKTRWQKIEEESHHQSPVFIVHAQTCVHSTRVCTSTHMYTPYTPYTYTSMHTLHTYTHIHSTLTRIHVPLYKNAHTHIPVHTHIHVCTPTRTHTHTSTHTYTHTSAHIPPHTYTHTWIREIFWFFCTFQSY